MSLSLNNNFLTAANLVICCKKQKTHFVRIMSRVFLIMMYDVVLRLKIINKKTVAKHMVYSSTLYYKNNIM